MPRPDLSRSDFARKIPTALGAAVLVALSSSLPALAQDLPQEVEGNFAGTAENGYFYSATLSREGDHLRLTIAEGLSPDTLTPALDNPTFELAPMNGTAWLSPSAEGPLVLFVRSENEGYLYTTRTEISHWDNMIVVLGHDLYVNRLRGKPPEDPFTCFSDSCWSCETDFIAAEYVSDGQTFRIDVPYDELPADLWWTDRFMQLGMCQSE